MKQTQKLLIFALILSMMFSLTNIFAVSAFADDSEATDYSVGENGNWWIGETDTGVKADGVTPNIAENGNWWIGETDTGIKAQSEDDDGKNKIIGLYVSIAAICMLTSLVALILYKPYRKWWIL